MSDLPGGDLPGSNLEPKPTACVPLSGLSDDGGTQPPAVTTSCCFHPDIKKWYPYDTVNGWDLTTECAGPTDIGLDSTSS